MHVDSHITPQDVADFFTNDESAAAQETQMDDCISELIREFQAATDVADPAAGLAKGFQNFAAPTKPLDFESYVETLAEQVVPFANRIASPRSLSHMSQGLPWFSRPLARLITAMNQNLTKFDASRSLSLCERESLAAMHRLVFERTDDFYREHTQNQDSTLGIITSGGTIANLTALWCARNTKLGPFGSFAGIERAGLLAALRNYGYQDAVVIGPESMHYSFAKAVGLMGLGDGNLIRVPLDAHGRSDVAAMRQAVADCHAAGQCVLAVVGVAGSTDAGAIDDLNAIADLAAEAQAAFHVDAAWGGPLLFSSKHRHKLAGIERADSVTLDGHKQLYLPLGIGMVLFRDPHRARAIEKNAHYLSRPGSADLGTRSLEGSRSGIALQLHAALRLFGKQGYAALIEHSLRMAGELCRQISHSVDFELLVCNPDSNVVLYRYVPVEFRDRQACDTLTDADHEAINEFNRKLQELQIDAGRTCVSRTTVHSTRYGLGKAVVALRAVIANPLTTASDLAEVLRDQLQLAQQLESQHLGSQS